MAEKALKVLAIDTATRIGSVALTDGHTMLGEYLLFVAKTHSEKLLALIHQILENTQISLNGVDIIAVSVGPGSFTGLRVGISTAQGLSFSFQEHPVFLPGLGPFETLLMRALFQE